MDVQQTQYRLSGRPFGRIVRYITEHIKGLSVNNKTLSKKSKD